METRANHVFVGAITLALLAALAGFFVWIAGWGKGTVRQYDIFFSQAVNGISKGSLVTFSGVPVGKIEEIELWPKDPSFVRVRIGVDSKVPVLVGTTATMQVAITGTGDILLDGAVKGAARLICPDVSPEALCPEGVPVIPTKRGGLGAILNSAPLLLDRLATLSERLNILLSDDNQREIKGILANTNQLTGQLADASPQVKPALAELQVTLKQATRTLASLDTAASSANGLFSEQGDSLARSLRSSLRSVQTAADELKVTLGDARPAVRQLSAATLPEAEAALRDLKATTRALRTLTEKIDDQGAGALTGGSKLPDYKP